MMGIMMRATSSVLKVWHKKIWSLLVGDALERVLD